MKVKILTVIGVALVAMVVASSGSAKWVIGNGTTDLEVTGPNPRCRVRSARRTSRAAPA